MWPYFVLIFIVSLFNFKLGRYNCPKQKFWLVLLLMIAFAGCRSNDLDYATYIRRGQDILTLADVFRNDTGMEPGYCILALIVNRLHLYPQFKVMAMNFIGLMCLGAMIRKLSGRWLLSLLVYFQFFFPFDMQTARSAVAIGITTLCGMYITEKNYVGYFLALIAAALFHTTALICVLLLPLYHVRVDKYIGLIVLFAEALFVKVVGIDRLALFTLDSMGADYFYKKYWQYASSVYAYPFKLWDPRLLLMIGLFFLAKWVFVKPSKLENFMTNCVFFAAALLVLFSEHTIVAYRLSMFFYVYVVVLVPLILDRLLSGKGTYAQKEMFPRVGLRVLGVNGEMIQLLTIGFFALLAAAYALRMNPYTVFFITGTGM